MTYTDVASGLNDKRRGLRRMFKDAGGGKFSRVFITYPDRLSRFCVAYLERHLAAFNVEVFYTDKHDKDTPQAELVSDMMAIIASFSGRLHGLRAKKNRLRDEKKIPGVLKKLERHAAAEKKNHFTHKEIKAFLDDREMKLMVCHRKRIHKMINAHLESGTKADGS